MYREKKDDNVKVLISLFLMLQKQIKIESVKTLSKGVVERKLPSTKKKHIVYCFQNFASLTGRELHAVYNLEGRSSSGRSQWARKINTELKKVKLSKIAIRQFSIFLDFKAIKILNSV